MTSIIQFQNKRMVVADTVLENTIRLAEKAARVDVPVLILGESGTGKELIARFIHEKSQRQQGPFVSVNCAAVPEGLLESEFFGFEKGAFTGALQQRLGKFERAKAGSLLLDEISEMPISLQAKLLRVLQENEIDRLGGSAPVRIDCRVIATSNRDPLVLIEENKFREDLFYRLNVVRIECPPLRGRFEAIDALSSDFWFRANEKFGFLPGRITQSALDFLLSYSWPGNIRELSNTIERAALLCEGSDLTVGQLQGLRAKTTSIKATKLKDVERDHIERTLDLTAGHQERAAAILGITSRTLRNKIKEYR